MGSFVASVFILTLNLALPWAGTVTLAGVSRSTAPLIMSLEQALKHVPSLRAAAARLSETIVETERPPANPRRKLRGKAA